MAKKDLNLKDLKGLVLSPGNIFWIQKSGAEVLVAKKADYLNLSLIEKLFKADHKMYIVDQMVPSIKHEFMGLIKAHESETLFKEKLQWKKRIFEILQQNKLSQFETSQLIWLAWSRVSNEEVKSFIDFDIDLFKRNLNVATSYALCAFLLGYYHDGFLRTTYSNAFRDLMSMEKIELMDRLKESLESIRLQDSLTDESRDFVQRLYPQTICWAGERYDGSGVHAFNKKEMSDLEQIMVALERHYSYRELDGETILEEIKNGKFKCETKLLSALKRSLIEDQKVQADLSA